MKSITLARAIKLLNDCSAVIVDDGAVTFPCINEDSIEINWDDSDGHVFENTFSNDSDLTVAEIDENGRLVLRDYVDTDGKDTGISMKLLYWKPLK